MHNSDTDADPVETASGDYKAYAVEHPVLTVRQFRAVRMAVKDGEEGDQQSRNGEWRTGFKQHGCSQQKS
jgi:hypothetical protein